MILEWWWEYTCSPMHVNWEKQYRTWPENTYGCRIDHPSQRHHPCLMLSESERLNIYVNDAMEDNDCQEVLNLWKNETKLIDISQKLKDTFERLLQNSEWREMYLPNKDEFYDMVKRAMQLDHRFYQYKKLMMKTVETRTNSYLLSIITSNC